MIKILVMHVGQRKGSVEMVHGKGSNARRRFDAEV